MKKILLIALVGLLSVGCGPKAESAPTSTSGVQKATVKIKVGADGLTVEQRNIAKRLQDDNKITSFKHLYIISPMTGDIILHSLVKGKVTSSGKRLTPKTVAATNGQYINSQHQGMGINIGGRTYRTTEVLGDDGTYGSSDPYIFWYDSKKVYHQHYVTGGQIIHVTSAPLGVNKVLINVDGKF